MAALAVVFMALGGMIPIATFVCPMMCMLLLRFVLSVCGKRIAWAWYGAVALLSVLLGPDKEAAILFVALGYYPILKPRMDAMKFGLVLKILLFNSVVLVLYGIVLHLFGMTEILAEYAEMGMIMTALTLVMGNVTFFLLDDLLGRKLKEKFRKIKF